MLKRFFLFTILSLSISCFSQKELLLVYTGNMGVYITNHTSSVLIDGLHTEYGKDYLFPPVSLTHKITYQLRPDAIIFTHHHGDHFSAPLADEYLKANKTALLYGSQQITKEISTHPDRLISIITNDYTPQTSVLKDLKITGIKINHAGKRHITVENVGYIIDFGHKKILHVGDTNWMEDIHLFDQLQLIKKDIDIAILPYWMLLEHQAPILIKKYINPKRIIATHISPRITKDELFDLQNKYPTVDFLTKLEQRIQL